MAKLKTQIGNCIAEQCVEPKYAHNLCKKHNQRRYKTGRIDLAPRVPWNKSGIDSPENLELWSSRQPKGQRIEDKVEYAMEILKAYAPHLLVGDK